MVEAAGVELRKGVANTEVIDSKGPHYTRKREKSDLNTRITHARNQTLCPRSIVSNSFTNGRTVHARGAPIVWTDETSEGAFRGASRPEPEFPFLPRIIPQRQTD